MYWNYRLIKHTEPTNECLELCEVYYDENTDKPKCYGSITSIVGEDICTIKSIFTKMQLALDKQILDRAIFEENKK